MQVQLLQESALNAWPNITENQDMQLCMYVHGIWLFHVWVHACCVEISCITSSVTVVDHIISHEEPGKHLKLCTIYESHTCTRENCNVKLMSPPSLPFTTCNMSYVIHFTLKHRYTRGDIGVHTPFLWCVRRFDSWVKPHPHFEHLYGWLSGPLAATVICSVVYIQAPLLRIPF